MKNENYFLMFVGGSGSGKTFTEKEAAKRGFFKLVSHTTRKLRIKDNEIGGIDYYFVEDEEFDKTLMVESIQIHGNKYGLSKKEVLSKDGDVVLVAEANGIKQTIDFIDNDPDVNYKKIIVLLDIDIETRRQNMLGRGDTSEAVENRLANEDIVKDFHDLGLVADITVTKMGETMDLIMEHIAELEADENNIALV